MSKISVIYNKISKTLIKIKNRSLLQPQKVPKVQHLYFNFQLICNPCHKDYKTLDNNSICLRPNNLGIKIQIF